MRSLHRAFRFVPLAAFSALNAVAAQQLESELHGTALYDHLGFAAASLGDLDGDGIDDFAVAAPMDHPTATGTGLVRAYSGIDLAILWTRAGSLVAGDYGHALARIGDLDGDGLDDLLVGAPDMDDTGGHDSGSAGRVEVLSGASGNSIHLLLGEAAFDAFGLDVAALGDIDGDGIDDFTVGAPGDNHGGIDAGSVRVCSGATGAELYTVRGIQPGGALGASVAGTGDVDGDGVGDLLVGAPLYDGSLTDSGGAFLYSGASGALLWSAFGAHYNARFGVSVAGVGDLDLDGTPDFAIGAPSYLERVYAYSGASRGLLFAAQGPSDSYFGACVVGVGDVDLDGRGDLLVGAPDGDVYGGHSGSAYLISGADGSELGLVFGEPNSRFGKAVHHLGDVDGDGRDEIGVFASGHLAKGRLRIYSIGPPLAAASYCTGKVNSQGCLPILASSGTPTLSGADDFVVHIENAINQKPGMVIWSRGLGTVTAFNSWLCLLPPIERTVASSSGGNGGPDDCSGVISFSFTHAYLQAKSLTAGTKVYAQGWFRDPAAVFGAGISTALVFTVTP
jgi:hypothetical protein